MVEEKLLTIRDVSSILGISEKEVIDLAESGKIPGYKVGGVYLRFKREQIEAFRKNLKSLTPKTSTSGKYSFTPPLRAKAGFKEKLSDFFYFNDFYILSVLIIVLILFIILRGY